MPEDFETTKARLRGEVFESPTLGRQGPVPVAAELPTIENLRQMSDYQVLRNIVDYGVTDPMEVMRTRAAKYVERLTTLTGDAFVDEVERLVRTESRSGLRAAARRVHQQWSTQDAAGGDLNKEFIWLTESDEDLCDQCEARGGLIATLAEWTEDGLPGSAVCLGGDACRCDLILMEEG